MNIALREGGVLVTLDMGGDPLKVTVRPDNARFDDNEWHSVSVHRTVKEVSDAMTSFTRHSLIHLFSSLFKTSETYPYLQAHIQ